MVNGFDKINQRLGAANTIVVFYSQKDAVFGGIVTALTQTVDCPLVGLFTVNPFGFPAGEYSNVWGTQYGGMINPFFHICNLGIAFFALGQGEIIAYRGAADIHTT